MALKRRITVRPSLPSRGRAGGSSLSTGHAAREYYRRQQVDRRNSGEAEIVQVTPPSEDFAVYEDFSLLADAAGVPNKIQTIFGMVNGWHPVQHSFGIFILETFDGVADSSSVGNISAAGFDPGTLFPVDSEA